MKGLEALEKIRNWKCFIDFEIDTNGNKEFGKEIAIIEKELKEKEELEIMYSNCVIESAKQKKALDALLELLGDIQIKQYNKKPTRYEIKICGKCFYVGKEEYEPLKEILK